MQAPDRTPDVYASGKEALSRASDDEEAFTLIELSIVLVIIGLIVGAIFVGKELIRAATIRKVINEYNNYVSAVNTFKGKFNCIPGDCANATALGLGNNGDGDELIAGPSNNYPEIFLFWQHLANAGLVAGSYTGASGPGWQAWSVIGSNSPQSAYASNTGWTAYYSASPNGNTDNYPQPWTNQFEVGTVYAHNQTYGPALLAMDASAIDQKIDDGMPGTGNVHGLKPSPSLYDPNCSTSANATTAVYNVNYAGNICALLLNGMF